MTFFYRLTRVGLLILWGGGVCSCIEIPDRPRESAPKADVTYHFDGGRDLPSLFTLQASYPGADGRTVTERISSLPWSRTLSVTLPFDAALKVAFSAQEQIPEKSLYDVGFDGYITAAESRSGQLSAAATRAGETSDALVLKFTCADEAAAQRLALRIAPLRYDKHFAFTLTVDDCWTSAFSQLWNRIHAKWMDDNPYHHLGRPRTTGRTPEHPLAMGDGCGNARRFGFSCAVWPSWGNAHNTTFVKELEATGDKSIYLAWEELGRMSDFGVSLLFHNIDERVWGRDDPLRIADGLREDYLTVLRRLGVRMKILGLPDGNEAYLRAAERSDLVAFVRNSLAPQRKILLRTCGPLYRQETYGGDRSQEVADKLAELAAQAEASDPYWVAMTIHQTAAEHIEMLEKIYALYGEPGRDDLWVASWDEIYEYVALREGARIVRSVEGRTATFEVRLPDCAGFLFPALTFLADGAQGASVEAASGNIVGLASASRADGMLVDVAFGDRLPALAEKYTDLYETDPTDETLSDARYFVGQLLPALAEPFERRLSTAAVPGENQVTRKGAERYRARWDGYELETSRRIAAPQ